MSAKAIINFDVKVAGHKTDEKVEKPTTFKVVLKPISKPTFIKDITMTLSSEDDSLFDRFPLKKELTVKVNQEQTELP